MNGVRGQWKEKISSDGGQLDKKKIATISVSWKNALMLVVSKGTKKMHWMPLR